MFIRRFLPLQTATAAGRQRGVAYGQTADAQVTYFSANCAVFAGVTNTARYYNLSPAVKIYRRH